MTMAKKEKKRTKIKFLVLDVDWVLTDGGMYYSESGDEFKKFNTKDGLGIKKIMTVGVKVAFLSSGVNANLINNRAKLLGVRHVYVGTEEKMKIMEKWCTDLNISLANIAYIGDDENDLKVMDKVGLSACPADAVAAVKKSADVHLLKKGGEGCVREFIERFIMAI